jgi:hypothetical protein
VIIAGILMIARAPSGEKAPHASTPF